MPTIAWGADHCGEFALDDQTTGNLGIAPTPQHREMVGGTASQSGYLYERRM
jgi:hypothetical protein